MRKDNDEYIVKVKKLEHIYPLDKIKKIEEFKNSETFEANRVELVQKHLDSILETGVIPKELLTEFDMSET